MLDSEDNHFGRLIANAIEHSIGSPTCRPDTGQFLTEWLANSTRLGNDCASQEFGHRSGDRLREVLSQRAPGRWGQDQLVAASFGH